MRKQSLTLRELKFVLLKRNSSVQYLSNSILSSQFWTLNVDKTQCLVMILEIFPETGDVEIICPVKLRSQFCSSNNEVRVNNTVNSSEYFGKLPVDNISIVPRALSHVRPNQSIRWLGSHIDFSSFLIKPAPPRSNLLLWLCYYTLGDHFLWPSHHQEK